MMKMKNNRNKSEGITLIALVVTIIVLLILAGISVQMLTGDNGILIRAGEAKEITDIAEIEETLKLEYLSLLTGQYVGDESATFARTISNYNTNNPTKPQVTSESSSGQIEIDRVELSSTNIQIGVDTEDNSNIGTVEVTVVPKENTGLKHYVTIGGKKYEVKNTNGDIKINRIPISSTGTEITIGATVVDGTIAEASVSGTTITIMGKLVVGNTTLNLTINGTPYTDNTINIVAKALLKPGGTAVATETDNYTDSYGKTATVPKGFTVSSETGTTPRKTDETSIDSGLVIKKGSDEYVWIEVPRSIYTDANYTTDLTANEQGKKEVTSATDYDRIYKVLNRYAYTYREGKAGQGRYWQDEWYDSNNHTYDGINWYKYDGTLDSSYSGNTEDSAGCGFTRANYISQYQRMLKSVYTNGGFWIGRYEASSNSTAPLSQSGNTPQTSITCSNAQNQAEKVATSDTTNNPNSVNYTSSLMFGIQWDLVCKFLDGSTEWDTTSHTASWYINTDSSIWGNYGPGSTSGSKKRTGSSATYRRRNIYDFAGNVFEWTLEHATSSSSGPCSRRGGCYTLTGSGYPASHRYDSGVSNPVSYLGFRVALY